MASASKIAVPRGTQDVAPDGWRARFVVLDAARAAFDAAGFGRVSTPTFEDTALFKRGVGEGTDVVSKEMYTFTDRSDRSLTLRPEGTAPVVRAYISESMARLPQPVKLWYFAPMFRYEKPQEGRYREHFQIGAELFGSALPAADAELIALADGIYRTLGVPHLTLRLNSIGDAVCRPAYRERLIAYLHAHEDRLCADTRSRIDENPLRAFDCKQPQCQAVMVDAPKTVDHLCEPCAEHHADVLAMLDAAGIEYTNDSALVRGLDYYTRTTFEFSCSALGAQDAIGGGGRYDGLVDQLGGPATPAVGFGSGIERLLLALATAPDAEDFSVAPDVDVYVCVADDSDRPFLFGLTQRLRASGIRAELDLAGRSLSGQLKAASKQGAALAVSKNDGELIVHAMRGRENWPTTHDTIDADITRHLAALQFAREDISEGTTL